MAIVQCHSEPIGHVTAEPAKEMTYIHSFITSASRGRERSAIPEPRSRLIFVSHP